MTGLVLPWHWGPCPGKLLGTQTLRERRDGEESWACVLAFVSMRRRVTERDFSMAVWFFFLALSQLILYFALV